jgi:hypothetical protein
MHMAIPNKVKGAGNNSAAQNVFKIVFSQALSSVPTLEAWDDDTFATVVKEMFAGTSGNGNKPFLSAVATTDAAPASAWKPASPAAGGATINRLKGNTNYVNLAASPPALGGSVRFNLNWELPSDASVPSTTTMNGVLAVRYAYSGSAPTLTWQFNDNGAGGTEGAPQWTTITPGAAGSYIRPVDSGATAATLYVTKPLSSVADQGEIWVTST